MTNQAPNLERRTLTSFGYAVAILVPVLIAALGLTILHFNYDPEDVVKGKRVPLLTSSWRPGQGGDSGLIAGTVTLTADGCLALVAADGTETTAVWPFDYEATVYKDQLRLYDTDRKIVAREGDVVQMGGGFGDVGNYAGRPCAPDSGEVAFVQSEVTVTARADN